MKVEVIAKYTFDENYFQSYWRDWSKSRSVGRKWAIPIGVFFITTGVLSFVMSSKPLLSLIVFFIGLVNLIWHFWEKRIWFNNRRSAKNFGKENKLCFSKEGILIESSHSKGEMTWEALESIKKASDGLFLVLQKEISIYIPKQSVTNETDLNLIVKMYRDSNA